MDLILELHENGTKVAELPLSAMTSWTPRQVVAFERIQELIGRTVMLRYSDTRSHAIDDGELVLKPVSL